MFASDAPGPASGVRRGSGGLRDDQGVQLADLRIRVIAGGALALAALAVTYLGGVAFAAFWFFAASAVFVEWQRVIGGSTRRTTALGVSALVLVGLWLVEAFGQSPGLAIPISVVAASSIALAVLAARGKGIWASSAIPVAAVVLVTPVLLRAEPGSGLATMLWLFAIVWGTDVGAYFSGRAIGGPRLWPRISPKKTWAGLIGGVLIGTVLSVLSLQLFGRPGVGQHQSMTVIVALAATTGIVSQLGDLAESAMKRLFDVKDSSDLIPGHGGAMDRLDGFWAACLLIGVLRLFAW